jgi:hypothetical protein
MKAFSITILEWIKIFFTPVKSNPGNTKVDKKMAVRIVQHEQRIPESEPVVEDECNIGELQRTAHRGNFAAGPYCVFDPRLIR